METAPYRDAPQQTQAQQLAAIGRRRREATGVDPHAAADERPASDVRSTRLDVAADVDLIRVLRESRFARRWGVFFLLVAFVMVPFAYVSKVAAVTGRPILAPVLLVAVFVVIGQVVSRRRNAPRQWLARRLLRVDGYLELVGREEHVERVLVRLAFDGQPPDVQFVRDLLAGAGCESAGVDELWVDCIGIHAPPIAGDAKRLHGWFQSLTDRALVPLHETHPIARVAVEER